MVERGGLNYPITVRDEFSRSTQLFRAELLLSRRAFRAFVADLASSRGGARSLSEAARAARDLARAQRDQARAARAAERPLSENERILRRLNLEARRQLALERESVRIRNTQAADARRRAAEQQRQARVRQAALAQETRALNQQQRAVQALAQAERQRERTANAISRRQQRDAQLRLVQISDQQRRAEALAQAQLRAQRQETARRVSLDPTLAAQRRINQEVSREAVLRRQIELLRGRARAQIDARDILGGQQTLRRARQLEESLRRADRSANSLLFTFRRLVGVLAIFTLARRAVQVFNDLVSTGVRFNDVVQSSTIGVAGLISTLTDVRNELGQSVDSARELELAMGLAREQVFRLRQDSLRTVATFEELLDTFQIALAPGFAAGLELDEIRRLTVSISQAASAIGLPQNQLAEEIRSLLSGTIQARTTRIATALGITNADIRRLREAGRLFEFLESRFEGFAQAAERQARSTLSGIFTLIRGATSELLGRAAQPLFEELLDLGGDLFDRILTIRDAADNIRPNPEAVRAFRNLFEALRTGVQRARELGEGLGFEGLQDLLNTLGAGLLVAFEALIGFARGFLTSVAIILRIVGGINSILGISARQLGLIAGLAASISAAFFVWRNAIVPILGAFTILRALLLRISTRIALNIGLTSRWAVSAESVAAAISRIITLLLVVPGAVQLLARTFTGLEVTFTDTFRIIGLVGEQIFRTLIFNIERGFKNLANTIVGAFTDPLGTIAARLQDFVDILSGLAAFTGADALQQRLERASSSIRRFLERRGTDGIFSNEELNKDFLEFQATIDGIRREYEALVVEIQNRGRGLSLVDDPTRFEAELRRLFESAAGAATAFVSTADKPINDLASDLIRVQELLDRARLEFRAARLTAGLEGPGGDIARIFTEAEVENAELLRGIQQNLLEVERRIAEVRARSQERPLDLALLGTGVGVGDLDQSGQLRSLLRDQSDLQDAINLAQETSNQLALTRAAILATEQLPSIREENILLSAQAAEQRAITAALVADLDPRQQALVAATTALDVARQERDVALEKADANIRALQAQIAAAPAGDERTSLELLLAGLEERRDLEAEILALKIRQLERAQQEADLIANGSTLQGLGEGLNQFAEEFSSTFQAGVAIARGSIEALTQFASQALVDAFDPTVEEGAIRERFARVLQGIAQLILQQLIQLAIARAILGFAPVPGAGVGPTGPVLLAEGGPVGFARGGRVRRKGTGKSRHHRFAPGYARGGLSPLDTVPAMLRPGEFVVRKEAVDALGLQTLMAINGGNFPVTASSDAAAARPSVGMQTGGLVSDQLANTARSNSPSSRDNLRVLPAVVANERHLDTMLRSGRNAFLGNLREDGSNINALLDRGASRR